MTDTENIKKQYQDYKKEIDKIKNRYSETFVKPENDMPESLGLKTMEYEMPSDEQLKKRAETSLAASRQAEIDKINRETSQEMRKQSKLKDKAFEDAAKRLIDIDNTERQEKKDTLNDALARNLARSSIASEGVKQVEAYANAKRAQTEKERDSDLEEISREIEEIKRDFSQALSENEKNYLLKLNAETEKLKQEAEAERKEAQKYNNTVMEKQAEYETARKNRTKELEQQEWDRLARLNEIKNEQGETALQSMRQKEILSATKNFFDSMSPADALGLFLADTSMREILGDDYIWFLNYLQKRKNK